MKTLYKILFAAGTLACLAGCKDLTELSERVDDLENRVTILESKLESLNSNIAALQTLAGETFINSVSHSGDTWTITLANGETLTINQGSTSDTPILSINADGNWTVDYRDGNGAQLLGGTEISATGKDGVTPLFGVDSENYWTVSYDGGTTYSRVLDPDGNPVSAVPEGSASTDSFFSGVAVDEAAGTFTLTLHDGTAISLAIVPEFLCAIEGSEGIQVFDPAQTRTWTMNLVGVTEDGCVVTAPGGWSAYIEDNILSVTAPASDASTKAVIADTRTDVSVLAFYKNWSTVAKLKVQLGTASTVTPVAAVSPAASTETDKVCFTVSLTDATSYRYILREATAEAPAAATVISEGTSGTDAALTISGCSEYTLYTVYLVPMYGDVPGEMVSATSRSGERNWTSLYEKYNAGFDIIIGERTYNKTVYGEATLVETSGDFNPAASDPRVVFIKSGVTLNYAYGNSTNIFLFIGDEPGARSATMTLSGSNYFRARSDSNFEGGELLFYNLVFDSTERANYIFTNSNVNTLYPYVAWIDCSLKTPGGRNLCYVGGNTNGSYDEIRIQDCDWEIISPSSSAHMLIHPNQMTWAFGSIIFKNNVFYAQSPANIRIFTGQKGTLGAAEFTNNTFYNISGDTNFWIQSQSLGKMILKDNLFVCPSDLASNFGFYRTYNTTQTTGNIYDGHTGITGEVSHNAYWFNTVSEYDWQVFWYGTARADISLFTTFEEPVELTSNPFVGGTADPTTGTFTPAAAWASYGAVR